MDIEAHMNTFECSICTSDKLITHMNIQGIYPSQTQQGVLTPWTQHVILLIFKLTIIEIGEVIYDKVQDLPRGPAMLDLSRNGYEHL